MKGGERFWDSVIEAFYEKYAGIASWHRTILRTAKSEGKIVVPSGRYFPFAPEGPRGNWPEPKIKNYPVQGMSSDIVMLVRAAIFRRLIGRRDDGILLVNTVHDSILVDCKSEHVQFVARTFRDVFKELPKMIDRCFKTKFNVPMDCTIEVGTNYRDMEAI